ncbi:MAG TPA: GNAT family N-acetyltransferase [Albidovulum sp.]|uniref:GNAT family N-acetyltransferase n=1 Tax=Albidovulum sp. TaxID=1872424 RepID=UPI002CB00511|nr:GNAT family N-acetyltransferase [Albidovulum sp.]
MCPSISCHFGMLDPLATARNWRGALARHLTRLDLGSRLDRFFTPAPDRTIRDYVAGAAPIFVVTAERGGDVCGVAEVHPHHNRPSAAEIAVSVDEDLRRRGIGRALFSRALAEAQARGIEDIWVVYLRGNEAMGRIADRAGFASVAGDDPGTITAHLIDFAPMSGGVAAGAEES